MAKAKSRSRPSGAKRSGLALPIIVLVSSFFLYLAGQRTNPPGFYVDESSIAYNALSIARTGHDEWGESFPLYFRAFGEYKNPVYIYLLAAVFRLFSPGNLIARRFSAILGFCACCVLGWLGFRISGRRWIGWITFATAFVTPQLFEISRLVFEVALMPLATALFLFAAFRAARSEGWSAGTAGALAGTLVLLTYTYSTGRALGAMFLVALLILIDRRQKFFAWCGVLAIYVAAAVVPLWIYNARHDGALTARFEKVRIPLRDVPLHYVEHLWPGGLATQGDFIPRHHVQHSLGMILIGTFVLVAISSFVIVRERRRDRWWLFMIAVALLSIVPAALTEGYYSALRLSTYTVALLILSIPALEAMSDGTFSTWPRRAVGAALVIGGLQAAFFFHVFVRDGPNREGWFDVGIREVLYDALNRGTRPVYIASGVDETSVHCLWYAALRDVPASAITKVPRGFVVPRATQILVLEACPGCALLSQSGPYAAYRTP